MNRSTLLCFFLVGITLASCRSVRRVQRDVLSSASNLAKMAAENRQLGSGLFTFGTLVSPLLLLMGMGSFVSMLPQMFQTVMQGVGPNLSQLFNPSNLAAAGGGSSSRLRRRRGADGDLQQQLTEDLLDEIQRRLNLAVLKNERPLN